MKNLIQNSVLSFGLFVGALALLGCDQVSAPESQAIPPEQDVAAEHQQENPSSTTDNSTELKSGNMFYIVRDVADVQLKAGNYIEQLQQTRSELQSAVDAKDTAQLQTAASQLQQQLTDFNQALTGLNLKSQEIDQIRENILTANQQVLASPFLNGQMDLNKVDFQKIEQQMGNVQSEMLKLAAMLIPNGDKESNT